jgi:oligoribonuclease NrnB/cAMP/cGMP phosphodiesterase (DHH superfamily)
MKIKLFTHTDLDGLGCAIIGQLVFRKNNIDITYCNYNDVNEKVEDFFFSENNYSKYDKVFITDISINDDLADRINKSLYTEPVQLLDHHPTALELNKYDWCTVQIEDDIEKVSGTSLFYKYLIDNSYIDEDEDIFQFVEKVKRYDTWLWTTKYNDAEAKQLNDLLYIYGRDRFISKFVSKLYDYLDCCMWSDDESLFNDTDNLLLELEQNKIDNYIESKSKEMMQSVLNVHHKFYKVGIVFAEQYISQLGNELAKNNTNLDFIVIITNLKTISYRGIKDNIDLGKDIASIYGGGGHSQSAGSPINDEVKDKILSLIFGIEE